MWNLQCVYWNWGHPDNESQSGAEPKQYIPTFSNPTNQMAGTKQWNVILFIVMHIIMVYVNKLSSANH